MPGLAAVASLNVEITRLFCKHPQAGQQILAAAVLTDKLLFGTFPQAFHSDFRARRNASVAQFGIVNKLQRSSPAEVTSPLQTAFMLRQTPHHIRRNSRVK